MNSARLLVIDDDPEMALALRPTLEGHGFEVVVETRGDLGLARARGERFDAVLTDVWLPGLDGLELTRRLRAERARLPVVVMTGQGTPETAIEAMKLGAYDFLLKPFAPAEMLLVLQGAVEAGQRMTEPVTLGPEVPVGVALIGTSRVMQAVYKDIGRYASQPPSVLIRGEPGTGKKLVARALYQHSNRADQAFVTVDCAAIPEKLLESELFGHERGAFAGAEARRVGRFEQAAGGTLFFDEIGELTPGTQAKLLRFLQDQTFQRMGGREPIRVDVRILAGTSRDLEARVRGGGYAAELHERLAGAQIFVPALRERLDDLPALVRYFALRHGSTEGAVPPSFLPEALERLRSASWPGNVRELEGVVRKALGRSQGQAVTLAQLEAVLTAARPVLVSETESLGCSLRDLASELLAAAERGDLEDPRARLLVLAERAILEQAMTRAEGDEEKAARWLCMSRPRLQERLRAASLRAGLRPKEGGALGGALAVTDDSRVDFNRPVL